MTVEPIMLDAENRGPSEGPVTVLLHSLALDRRVWEPAIGDLVSFGQVVLLDLRGHGRSPASHDFTIEDMADDVAATLSKLGHEKAAVVGMSMGGCVAQALATRHPDQVRALGLLDTTAWYGTSAPEDWAGRAAVAESKGLTALSSFQLTRWFSDDFRAGHPGACAELLEIFAANDLASYQASCKALGAFDARSAVSTISVPTVIVVGELDEATPPTMAEDLQRRITGSSLHVIPGSKHLTAYERPTDVVGALARILNSSGKASRSTTPATEGSQHASGQESAP